MSTRMPHIWITLVAATVATGMVAAGPPVNSDNAPGILDEVRRAFEPPSLLIGDPAPAFEPSGWVGAGTHQELAPGRVYVLDFWASWCGPCIAAMPHMSDLQEELGETATIIAVNVREADPDTGAMLTEPASAARIKTFLESLDDRIQLPVALGDRRLDASWLAASGRSSLPTYAVVSQDLKLAWVGDESDRVRSVVGQLLTDDYDVDVARTEQLDAARVQFLSRTVNDAAVSGNSAGDLSRFNQLCAALSFAADASEASYLASIMNTILTHPVLKGRRDLATAERGSRRACQLTDWKDPEAIRVLSLATFMGGDADEAIKLAEKALSVSAPDDSETRARIEANLVQYRTKAD